MIKNILSNKCPNCHTGKIYKQNNFLENWYKPKMHKSCTHCGYVFEKEPGFFFGAMYVSYAIGIIEAIMVVFAATFYYENIFNYQIFIWIAVVLIALSSFNMRISRIIWIYLLKDI
ncbi:DUF983 domain-containing protein [Flagellimonas myxillae]|uniref:DUF983 domain-containing protein n=1 Tax=Flagellimonas myxillae TaxID=2942214 RepID=UPI00201EFAC2|nr:DUF983 domain-containing protein [Muricauda myxillae]MCL6267749.1 DUF983 domain-containing protein [Muricauda myxillae]